MRVNGNGARAAEQLEQLKMEEVRRVKASRLSLGIQSRWALDLMRQIARTIMTSPAMILCHMALLFVHSLDLLLWLKAKEVSKDSPYPSDCVLYDRAFPFQVTPRTTSWY